MTPSRAPHPSCRLLRPPAPRASASPSPAAACRAFASARPTTTATTRKEERRNSPIPRALSGSSLPASGSALIEGG